MSPPGRSMFRTRTSSIAPLVAIGFGLLVSLRAQDSQSWPEELDAVRAAPASHRVLFENSMVRVLEVRIPAGTKEPFHHHRWPSFFINIDSGGPIGASRFYDKNGKIVRDTPRTDRPTKNPPEWRITWMKPEPLHSIENLETIESARTLPWRPAVVRVELKGGPSAQDVPSWPEELDAVRAASKSHKVLFENSMVRVLEVRVPAGTKEPFHHHRWPSILLNLDSGGPTGASRFYDKDGKMVRDTPRTDQPTKNPPEWRVTWMEPESLHSIENSETAESSRTLPYRPNTIRVEFKASNKAVAAESQ